MSYMVVEIERESHSDAQEEEEEEEKDCDLAVANLVNRVSSGTLADDWLCCHLGVKNFEDESEVIAAIFQSSKFENFSSSRHPFCAIGNGEITDRYIYGLMYTMEREYLIENALLECLSCVNTFHWHVKKLIAVMGVIYSDVSQFYDVFDSWMFARVNPVLYAARGPRVSESIAVASQYFSLTDSPISVDSSGPPTPPPTHVVCALLEVLLEEDRWSKQAAFSILRTPLNKSPSSDREPVDLTSEGGGSVTNALTVALDLGVDKLSEVLTSACEMNHFVTIPVLLRCGVSPLCVIRQACQRVMVTHMRNHASLWGDDTVIDSVVSCVRWWCDVRFIGKQSLEMMGHVGRMLNLLFTSDGSPVCVRGFKRSLMGLTQGDDSLIDEVRLQCGIELSEHEKKQSRKERQDRRGEMRDRGIRRKSKIERKGDDLHMGDTQVIHSDEDEGDDMIGFSCEDEASDDSDDSSTNELSDEDDDGYEDEGDGTMWRSDVRSNLMKLVGCRWWWVFKCRLASLCPLCLNNGHLPTQQNSADEGSSPQSDEKSHHHIRHTLNDDVTLLRLCASVCVPLSARGGQATGQNVCDEVSQIWQSIIPNGKPSTNQEGDNITSSSVEFAGRLPLLKSEFSLCKCKSSDIRGERLDQRTGSERREKQNDEKKYEKNDRSGTPSLSACWLMCVSECLRLANSSVAYLASPPSSPPSPSSLSSKSPSSSSSAQNLATVEMFDRISDGLLEVCTFILSHLRRLVGEGETHATPYTSPIASRSTSRSSSPPSSAPSSQHASPPNLTHSLNLIYSTNLI
eukprot:GHVN01028915.1.p1 GENE.GHVN01028915.1~~GHVN01028915.1.p1  ORF type:complete len:797 (+),score=214.12 GHVN01028915.1:169-2559(+)